VEKFDQTFDIGYAVRILLKLFSYRVSFDHFALWVVENTEKMWKVKKLRAEVALQA